MNLQVKEINNNYFYTTQNEIRKCAICQENFEEGPNRKWVAHENPNHNGYGITTRSFFHYIHPMHSECYGALCLRAPTPQCPECSNFIGEGNGLLEPTIYFTPSSEFEPQNALLFGKINSDTFLLGLIISVIAIRTFQSFFY